LRKKASERRVRRFTCHAMQVEARVDIHLAPAQALGVAPVEPGE
jgi:hypothetical protein